MVVKNREMKQPDYKLGNRTLIGSAILVIIFFLLCSCGSRKVDRSKTEIKETQTTESTFKDSSKTVTKIESNTKIVDISQSDEFVIVPFDNTKEMVVNGKTYFNTVLKRSNSKNNITTDKTINVAKTIQKDVKKATKENKYKVAVSDIKNIDKKQFNFLSLWWLIPLIAVIYFGYRKFKGLPLV